HYSSRRSKQPTGCRIQDGGDMSALLFVLPVLLQVVLDEANERIHVRVTKEPFFLHLFIARRQHDFSIADLDVILVFAIDPAKRVVQIVITRSFFVPLPAGVREALGGKLLLRVKPELDGDGRDRKDGKNGEKPDPATAAARAPEIISFLRNCRR